MVTRQEIIVGFLLLLITSTAIYINFEDVRIRVDDDKTSFYGKNDVNRWVVVGREYNSLFDGSSKMNRRTSKIVTDYDIDEDVVTITRTTPMIRGPVIKDTYLFNGKINDITLFPISHTVEIFNGSGFFYRYEVRDLFYDGLSLKLNGTSMSFGMDMSVEWEPNYRWGKLYRNGVLKVQYDVKSDYEVFNVRLYDPPTRDMVVDRFLNVSVNVSSNQSINITENVSVVVPVVRKEIFNKVQYDKLMPGCEYTKVLVGDRGTNKLFCGSKLVFSWKYSVQEGTEKKELYEEEQINGSFNGKLFQFTEFNRFNITKERVVKNYSVSNLTYKTFNKTFFEKREIVPFELYGFDNETNSSFLIRKGNHSRLVEEYESIRIVSDEITSFYNLNEGLKFGFNFTSNNSLYHRVELEVLSYDDSLFVFDPVDPVIPYVKRGDKYVYSCGVGDCFIDPSLSPSTVSIGTVPVDDWRTDRNVSVGFSVDTSTDTNRTDWRKDGLSMMILNAPFEGNSSNALLDLSSNSVTLTNTNAVWGASNGVDGNGAWNFTNSQYIGISGNIVNGLTKWSVGAWIKPTDAVNTRYWFLRLGGTGADQFSVTGNDFLCDPITTSGRPSISTTDNSAQNGNWYFIVCTFDSTTNTGIMYVNGTQVKNQTSISFAAMDTSTSEDISGRFSAASAWSGTIDDFFLTDGIVTPEQVSAMYNAGSGRTGLLVSQETSVGDKWQGCVTPFNSSEKGTSVCSGNVTIYGVGAPVQATPTINSSNGQNGTNENITVFNVSTGGSAINRYDWRIGGSSWAGLNLPMEGNSSNALIDITDNVFVGTNVGAVWNSTGGFDGNGAFEFDGVSDHISYDGAVSTLEGFNNGTISFWMKTTDISGTPFSITDVSSNLEHVAPLTGNADAGVCGSNEGISYFLRRTSTLRLLMCAPNTDGILNNEWVHIVIVTGDGDNRIYINGSRVPVAFTAGNKATKEFSDIDNPDAVNLASFERPVGGFDFNGSIDEMIVLPGVTWNDSQVAAVYANKTDTVVAEETTISDTLVGCINIFNSTMKGETKCSPTLTVIDVIPEITSNVLTASDTPINSTDANLTMSLIIKDSDDSHVNRTDWRNNSVSLAILNIPFEGNSSNALLDLSTNSNDVTVSAAVWNSTGGFDGNGAFEFDGSADYLDITGNIMNGLTEWSIGSWIYPTSLNANSKFIFRRTAGPGNSGTYLQASTGKYVCDWATSAGRVTILSSGGLSINKWHHIICTFNSDTDNLKIYVDGVLNASSTSILDATGTATTERVGTEVVNAAFLGNIDEFQILDRELSAEQILAIFNNETDKLVSQETSVGDNISVCVTPFDSIQKGVQVCSNTINIKSSSNLAINSIILNASDNPFNKTDANLSIILNISGSGNIKNISDWRINNISLSVLNLAFEADTTLNGQDYSTFNNNLNTVTGAIFSATTGYDGFGSYTFDGVNDFLNISDDTTLDMDTNNFTVELWVNVTPTNVLQPFITKKNDSNTKAGWQIFLTEDQFDGKQYLRATFTANSVESITNNDGVADFDDSKWHHIAVVFDRSNDLIIRYVDGVQTGFNTDISVNTGSVNNGENLVMGKLNDTLFLGGGLDEISIWNRSLSPEQILAIFNNRTDLFVSQETSVNDTFNACVTINDGVTQTSEKCSNNITILDNTAPVMNTSRITPLIAFTNDTLIGFCNATDLEGSNITYSFEWFKNNVSFKSGTTGSFFEATEVNVDNLSSSNTSKTEIWILQCIANDGSINSLSLNSSSLTILNTPPVMNTSRITPTPSAFTDDILVGFCNATDIDGDTLTYNFTWFNETVPFTNGLTSVFNQSIEVNVNNLSDTNTVIGQNWTLGCFVSDGTNISLSINSSITNITNATFLFNPCTPLIQPFTYNYNNLSGYSPVDNTFNMSNAIPDNQSVCTFNATNNEAVNLTLRLKVNQTVSWLVTECGGINLTTSFLNIFTVTNKSVKLFNCTQTSILTDLLNTTMTGFRQTINASVIS